MRLRTHLVEEIDVQTPTGVTRRFKIESRWHGLMRLVPVEAEAVHPGVKKVLVPQYMLVKPSDGFVEVIDTNMEWPSPCS